MSIWKYCLNKAVTVTITDKDIVAKYGRLNSDYEFKWATLTFRTNYVNVTAKEGYSWDGCSPKKRLGNIIFGIWDGPYDADSHLPQTYYASLVHDILCQYKGKHPIIRKDMDKVFYRLLVRDRFFLAPIYYYTVRLAAILAGKG